MRQKKGCPIDQQLLFILVSRLSLLWTIISQSFTFQTLKPHPLLPPEPWSFPTDLGPTAAVRGYWWLHCSDLFFCSALSVLGLQSDGSGWCVRVQIEMESYWLCSWIAYTCSRALIFNCQECSDKPLRCAPYSSSISWSYLTCLQWLEKCAAILLRYWPEVLV